MERYFTNTTHTDVTDGLCESVLRTIMSNARILKRDHTNYDAWAEIALAGTVAHNGLLGLGREEDWGCHNMEHELSAIYDVAHGAGLAVVTPAWMRHIYKEHLPIFVQFAVNVMGVGGGLRDLEAVALEGIRRLQAFFTEMGQPSTLAGLGIDSRHLAQMAYKPPTGPTVLPKLRRAEKAFGAGCPGGLPAGAVSLPTGACQVQKRVRTSAAAMAKKSPAPEVRTFFGFSLPVRPAFKKPYESRKSGFVQTGCLPRRFQHKPFYAERPAGLCRRLSKQQ